MARTQKVDDAKFLKAVIEGHNNGETAEEIASRLGMQPNSLVSRLSKTRSTMRKGNAIVRTKDGEEMRFAEYWNACRKGKTNDEMRKEYGSSDIAGANFTYFPELTVVKEGDVSKLPMFGDSKDDDRDKAAELLDLISELA